MEAHLAQRLSCLKIFLHEEAGQDIIEYSLLITFVAIACAAIVGTSGSATVPIWSSTNMDLSAANATATAGS